MIRRVACAISGGVDSAIAAHLLKLKGFSVTCVFMHNWDRLEESGLCSQDLDREDAFFAARTLDLPFREVEFIKEYWHDVFNYFLESYKTGRTPNPDIMCNKYVKFKAFYDYAMNTLGVDAIATGHYARSNFGDFLELFDATRNAKLLLPTDSVKDQTFFLCQIPQIALRRTMFPLATLTKGEVKQIACNIGLRRLARKHESMGVCFLGKRRFPAFIDEYVEDVPGVCVDIDSGNIVGRHKGHHHYTVGQRVRLAGLTTPYYVVEKCLETKELLVCSTRDHPSLFATSMVVDEPYWIAGTPPALSSSQVLDCNFKFQHTDPLCECRLERCLTTGSGDAWVVHLPRPFRALTAGQFAVFYAGEECLGGAQIRRPGASMFEKQAARRSASSSSMTV